jgi:two-component system chemotaxis sensor kinase CheA
MRTIIKLPLTLAIIKALLVVADGETLAIPIQAVRENIQVERDQIKTVQQRDVIMLRDEVLPLYDLAECLGFKRLKIDGPLPIIVVEIRGQKVGFVVEDLIGQQEIVIKSIKGTLSDIRGIAGATVLGNGTIALIIDNSTLIG